MLTKRQRDILEFIKEFVAENAYAPSLEEIGAAFGLSSVATVHKHLNNLVDRGVLRRGAGSRSIEVIESQERDTSEIPLLGRVAAGRPIEAVAQNESLSVPPKLLRGNRRHLFALEISGDSMLDEGIHDGDYVIVESREDANNGDTVIALVHNEEATCKLFYRETGRVRLQPANDAYAPMMYEEEDVRIQGVVVGLWRDY